MPAFWVWAAGEELLGYQLLVAAVLRGRAEGWDQLRIRAVEIWISQEYEPSLHLEKCFFQLTPCTCFLCLFTWVFGLGRRENNCLARKNPEWFAKIVWEEPDG